MTQNVLITDDNGCTFNDLIIVEQLNTIASSFLINDPIVTNQQTAVLIQVSGGNAPYTYDWFFQGGLISNNQNISNLGAGVYNLTITDNNCYRDFNVTLVEPNEFLASVCLMMFLFSRNNGSIASSFWGTSPYTSFLMDDTNNS